MVRAGEPGAAVGALALAYLNGQLVNEPEGCADRHDATAGTITTTMTPATTTMNEPNDRDWSLKRGFSPPTP